MTVFKSPEWASRIDVGTAGRVIDAISRPRLSSYGMNADPSCDLVAVLASARESALIDRAVQELRRRRKPPSPDNIVAELTFGFWCSMFDRRYEPPHTNEPCRR